MRVQTTARPYVLTFPATGGRYSVSSESAQRLIDSYPAIVATRSRVVLRADDGSRVELRPATVGGGVAFEVSK